MKLWRGDSDSKNIRQLRMSLPRVEGLLSNMINGGNPLALAQKGFVSSIHQHVVPGWHHTHFLSFSKSKTVANGFAVGNSGKTLRLSNQQKWDAVVVELDFVKLQHVRSFTVGMDHYQFQELGLNQNLIQPDLHVQIARQISFQQRVPGVRNILLIDVFQHLSHLQGTGVQIDPQALAYSQNDKEVLVLPIDPLSNCVGNTALLDFGCVSNIEFFELI